MNIKSALAMVPKERVEQLPGTSLHGCGTAFDPQTKEAVRVIPKNNVRALVEATISGTRYIQEGYTHADFTSSVSKAMRLASSMTEEEYHRLVPTKKQAMLNMAEDHARAVAERRVAARGTLGLDPEGNETYSESITKETIARLAIKTTYGSHIAEMLLPPSEEALLLIAEVKSELAKETAKVLEEETINVEDFRIDPKKEMKKVKDAKFMTDQSTWDEYVKRNPGPQEEIQEEVEDV